MSAVPHRFVVPSYYPAGLQPGGQDFLNVVSGGIGGLDGSAWVSPKKVGGPNDGTYFWAWQEDALTGNFNRGLRALGENTDLLDDLLHRSLAIPTRVDGATAGETFVSLAMGSGVFLGIGTPPANVQPDMADYLASFFELVDDQDEEILNPATGDRVRVASLTLDPTDTLGGGNFAEKAVIVTFTEAIPVGVKFRLYYAVRGNLATLPVDALTYIKIRGAQEVPADIEQVLRSLHQPDSVGSHAWDAPWRATIWDLTTGGLNERYRHRGSGAKQTPPEDYFGNQDGEDAHGLGAWIRRDGPAVTIYADSDPFGGPHPFSDPLNALFATKFREEYDPLAPTAGAVGIALYGARRNGTDWLGESSYAPGGALMLGLWPHDFDASLSTTTPYTRITGFGTNNAELYNHGVYNLNTGEAVVELTNTDDYFQKAGNSAVAVGYDLLECTYTISAQPHRKVFVIVAMGETGDVANTKKCRIRCLDGTVPNFQAGYVDASSASVRWISTSFAVGDGAGARHATMHGGYANPVLLDGFLYQVPPKLSSLAGDNNVPRTAAIFSAADVSGGSPALQWGGFDQTAFGAVLPGSLLGDGSIECVKLFVADSAEISGDLQATTATFSDLVTVASGLDFAGELTGTAELPADFTITGTGLLLFTETAGVVIGDGTNAATFRVAESALASLVGDVTIGDGTVATTLTVRRAAALVVDRDDTGPYTSPGVLDVYGVLRVQAQAHGTVNAPLDGLLEVLNGGQVVLRDDSRLWATSDSVVDLHGTTNISGNGHHVLESGQLTIDGSHAGTPAVLSLATDATTKKGGKLHAYAGSWLYGAALSTLEWYGSASFFGSTSLEGDTVCAGSDGNIRYREIQCGTSSTYNVSTDSTTGGLDGYCDTLILQEDVSPADPQIVILHPPAGDGARLRITRGSVSSPTYTFTKDVKIRRNGSSDDVAVFGACAPDGYGHMTVELEYVGGKWRVMHSTPNPSLTFPHPW